MKTRNLILSLLTTSLLLVSCAEDETDIIDYSADTTAPPEVFNLAAIAEEGKVRLEWNNPETTDMVQIQITFSPANEASQPILVGPNSESYEFVNLAPDTEYIFTVRTVDIVVNRSEGVIASAKTIAPEVTDPTEFIDDRDGKTYKIVTIGDQVWMAENLAYIPPGSSFLNEIDGAEDEGQGFKPFYYVAGFSGGDMEALSANAQAKSNYDTYGVLYNWYAAVATPETVTDQAGLDAYLENYSGQGLSPEGWHLPTEEDFQKLLDALDKDETNAGQVLKAVTGWGTGGSDAYGYGLLPGGRRVDSHASGGVIDNVSDFGYWWTSNLTGYTDNSLGLQARITSKYASDAITFKTTTYRGSMGVSIRCVKDRE